MKDIRENQYSPEIADETPIGTKGLNLLAKKYIHIRFVTFDFDY
jgi:hypothetical protein